MDDNITISCDLLDNISSYYLLGMDDYFNFYKLEELETNTIVFNKEKYKDYFNYKIAYIKDNNIYKISDDLEYKKLENIYQKSLELNFIESYYGVSLQVIGEEIYDKYMLYEVINNKKVFILESKDFLILSKKILEKHTYYVEAYTKYDNYYVLANTSKNTICEYKKIDIKEYELTICIPVYNGEIFLPRTLDSVILSSYNKYRILIINDGSKDKTSDVLKWYSDKYNFIYSINNENNGVSYTRDMLLDMVDTKYMAFLDADDLVSPHMYEYLIKYIKETNSDVALCRTIERTDLNNNAIILNVPCGEYKIYTYEDMAREYISNSYSNIYFCSLVNKVVKTEIAKKAYFIEGKYYEDSAYTPIMYSYVNRFVFINNIAYIWDKRKRITYGTYSTEYKKVDIFEIVDYYFDATIYPINNCNKEHMDFVMYQSLKNLFSYYDDIKGDNSELFISYKNKLKDFCKGIDLNNKYLKSNKIFYNQVLELRKEE